MKQLNILAVLFLTALMTLAMGACSKHKTPAPKMHIQHRDFNENLKTYTPQVGTERFEYSFWIDYEELPTKLDCSLGFLMSWERVPNGYYVHFNNDVGTFLSNEKGQAIAFESGETIGDNTAGSWNSTVAISYDYVLNPSLNKGELAGKGDKYIAVKIWDGATEGTSYYYGWIKLNVSADGRDIKILSEAVQLDAGKSLKAGE